MVNPDNSKINVNYEPDDTDPTSGPSDQEVKPVKAPKSTKDFQKIYGRTRREGKDDEEGFFEGKKIPSKVFSEDNTADEIKYSKDDEENATDAASVSLFDLSKGSSSKTKEVPSKAKTERAESPSDLFRKMSSKEAKAEKVEKDTSRYAQEQPDLSYVNPMSIASPLPPINPVRPEMIEKPAQTMQTLQALVSELVKQLYTVEKKGQTDTVIILDNPPKFKDAKIIVSSFETAKGQVNIAFENLTQEAQRIIDLESNRKSLINLLNQNGYNVHILIATTSTSENIAPLTQESRDSRQKSDDEDDQQQNRKKR